MAFDPTSPRAAAMLQALRQAAEQASAGDSALRNEFQQDITGLRNEIQSSLGEALTRINAKVTDIDQAQQRLESAGTGLLEKMDKQQATYMTNLQQVVANAQSEFLQHPRLYR